MTDHRTSIVQFVRGRAARHLEKNREFAIHLEALAVDIKAELDLDTPAPVEAEAA